MGTNFEQAPKLSKHNFEAKNQACNYGDIFLSPQSNMSPQCKCSFEVCPHNSVCVSTPLTTELTPNDPKPLQTFQCKGSDRFQSAEGGRTDEFSSI